GDTVFRQVGHWLDACEITFVFFDLRPGRMDAVEESSSADFITHRIATPLQFGHFPAEFIALSPQIGMNLRKMRQRADLGKEALFVVEQLHKSPAATVCRKPRMPSPAEFVDCRHQLATTPIES